jgi:hypothetical protein
MLLRFNYNFLHTASINFYTAFHIYNFVLQIASKHFLKLICYKKLKKMKAIKLTFSVGLMVLSQLVLAQTGSWKLAGNSLTGTEKIGSKNSVPINFITNNTQRMTLTTAGNLGIGVTAPKGKLHVFSGSSGVTTPVSNSTLIVESNFSNFISLLNPTNNTSGILFGNTLNPADAAIAYNEGTAPRALVFKTGGGVPRMTLTSSGFLGLGTNSPASELHISHPNDFLHGLRIENNTAGAHSWNIFEFGLNDGDLGFAADGSPKSFIDRVSGAYSTISDLRAKKDIEQSPDVLEKVMQLQVKKYHFLANQTSDKKHYGMIAQDVEKIFPEIVSHKLGKDQDVYAVNYSAYGVIAIKAIQEQQKKIEEQEQTNQEQQQKITVLENQIAEQQKIINDLKSSIDQMRQSISSSSQSSSLITKTSELSGARLTQNAPNPFRESTSIDYYLPQNKNNATIEIVSANGQLVKSVPLTQKGNGRISLNSSELSAGIYFYTLKVDGVKVDSKQMVMMK